MFLNKESMITTRNEGTRFLALSLSDACLLLCRKSPGVCSVETARTPDIRYYGDDELNHFYKTHSVSYPTRVGKRHSFSEHLFYKFSFVPRGKPVTRIYLTTAVILSSEAAEARLIFQYQYICSFQISITVHEVRGGRGSHLISNLQSLYTDNLDMIQF